MEFNGTYPVHIESKGNQVGIYFYKLFTSKFCIIMYTVCE